MSRNDAGFDNAALQEYRGLRPPRVPGIIEGSMTMHPEPGGSVSFRVIIGNSGERIAKCDLFELIIGAEHIERLCGVLIDHGTCVNAGPDQMPWFPCHIGFRRDVVSAAG